MPQPDPLVTAAAAYAVEHWSEDDWRQLGRHTGTSDIVAGHSRLLRSMGFGDPDYPDAALEVMTKVVREAPEEGSGLKGRLFVVAESIPDLRAWMATGAPARIRRLFDQFLSKVEPWDIPEVWEGHASASTSAELQPSEGEDEWLSSTTFGDESRNSAEQGQHVQQPSSTSKTPIQPEPIVIENVSAPTLTSKSEVPKHIFIVHGHDEGAMKKIRVHVQQQTGILPVSLAEKPGRGDTIIEKFEREAGNDIAFVIVLLTPDDVGQTVGDHKAGKPINPRARQNVVLELGYFIGTVGRQNVVVVDAEVERPSDLSGLSYVAYGDQWKHNLTEELKAAGLINP